MTNKTGQVDHELIEQVFGEGGFADPDRPGLNLRNIKTNIFNWREQEYFMAAVKVLLQFYKENK